MTWGAEINFGGTEINFRGAREVYICEFDGARGHEKFIYVNSTGHGGTRSLYM